MVFGILALLSTTLVDTYFVGKLGIKQLAALSFTFPMVLGINSIAIGLGVGASSVVSRVIGSGDTLVAKRVTTDALILAAIIAIILAITGYLTIKPIFTLMGAEPTVLVYVKEYMATWFLSLLFLIIPIAGGSILRATGDSFWPSLMMVLSAIINVFLTPMLIMGKFSMPAFGIQGAAIATAISWSFTFFMTMYLIVIRDKLICTEKISFKRLKKSWNEILQVGIPSGVSQVIHPLSIAVITSFISHYGADYVAAFGVGTRIESLLLIPLFGLSAGIPPIAGQNWGARKIERIKETVYFSYLISFIWIIITSGLVFIFARDMASVFSDNTNVQNIASDYIKIVITSTFGYGLVMCSVAAFNAMGMPRISFAFSFSRSILFYIPLSYMAYKFGNEKSIFFAIALANILSGGIALFVSKKKFREQSLLLSS